MAYKGPQITARARLAQKTRSGELTENYAVDVVEGRIDAPPSVRWECAKWLYERQHGKTPEVQLTGELSDEARQEAQRLTVDQLLEIYEATKDPKGQATN